jgi:magnesium-transporting ATPase (P-type)
LKVTVKVLRDGAILEVHTLQVNEAALTGNSLPIDKEVGSQFFGGTIVLQGRGLGLVKETGKATRFGKIASLLEETESNQSPLQIKVNRIVKRMFLMRRQAGIPV